MTSPIANSHDMPDHYGPGYGLSLKTENILIKSVTDSLMIVWYEPSQL